MQFRPCSPAIGAEVTGLDLTQPLSDQDKQTLRQGLIQYGMLFTRGHKLSSQQLVDYARGFNEIERYETTMSQYLLATQPEIIVLSNIVENGKPIGVADGGKYWHTDRSYVAKPAWSSCLYALEVPHADDGTPLGDTLFSSMTAAHDALPQRLRERIAGLSAWHEYVFRFSARNDSMPGVAHPIIIKHPLSQAPCLYVNRGFTHKILGLPEQEAKDLMEELWRHAESEPFVYRHKWQVGDVLLWDNYSAQHCATDDYALPQRRHMWRTTIQGFPLQ